MTRRGWILALGAGLCASLPACQTSAGKWGLVRDQIVEAQAAPSPRPVPQGTTPGGEVKGETDTALPPSTYAMIPHKEKEEKSSKVAELANDSGPISPYSAIPKQTTPAIPPKVAAAKPELKLDTLLAVVKKQSPPVAGFTAVAAVPPEPPPPEPPTWDQDLASPTTYAPIRNQAPLPTPHPNLGSTAKTDPVSPYAAPENQQLVASMKQIPTSDSGHFSPYATISRQGAPAPVMKSPSWNPEALSPYSEIPNESASFPSARSFLANQPTVERTSSPAPVLNNGLDTPPRPNVDSETRIQQAGSPRELNFHPISETPAASGPEVGLDLDNNSSATPLDQSIVRKPDESNLEAALRCFLRKRPAEAIKLLKGYDEPNQELIMRLFPLIARIPDRDLTRAEAEKGTEIVGELLNVIGIPASGDLVIGKLCLCKHIKTFGDYDPFPEDHQFQPRDLVWIYAEVRNFTSERRDLGNGETVYETRLNTTARITNDANTREWELRFDRRYGLDRSRSLRRDYWDNLSFNVPDLPPGCYTLTLKVVDEPTGRFKERSVDFQVVPPRGM